MAHDVFRVAHHEKGQDLIELSLIFALIAIVVIGAVILLREPIVNSYCSLLYAITSDAQNTSCRSPIVTCQVQSWSASRFSMEAVVIDPDAPPGAESGSTIDHVAFYVNETLWHDWSGDGIDRHYPYCFPGGSGLCGRTSLPSGTKVTARAYDRSGYSGECSVRVP